MSRTSALRKQHDAIAVLAADVTRAADALAEGGAAEPLQRLLRQLDTILTAHLASEDRLLYPELLASGHRRAAATASRFCEEMGGLTDSYGEFAARWRTAGALLADPAGFKRDWTALSGALAFRIQRENAELYPLADALNDTSGREAG